MVRLIKENISYIQDIILILRLLKVPKKEFDMFDIEVMQIYILINILLKYNQQLDLKNKEIALNQGLQNIKKYQKYAAQKTNQFINLKYFFPVFTIFVNKTCTNYNHKMQLEEFLRFTHNWVILLFV